MKHYFTLLFVFAIPFFSQAQCDASFTISTSDTVCPQDIITFRANAPSNSVMNYNWSILPGSSHNQQFTYQFPYSTSMMNYTVILQVTGNNGIMCTSAPRMITVLPAPELFITVDSTRKCIPGSQDTIFRPTFTIDTTLTPLSAGPFTWNFGNDTTIVSSAISHQATYQGFGTYHVTVTAPGFSCPGYRISIPFYTDPVSAPQIVGLPTICEGDSIVVLNNSTPRNGNCYTWDWGNYGPTYTTCSQDSQSYLYDLSGANLCLPANLPFQGINDGITLTAFNDCNLTHTSFTQITIRARPRAGMDSVGLYTCMPNAVITFNNLSCPSANQNYIDPTQFLWVFGDGDSSRLANPTHDYTSSGPGTYHVKMFASNSCGIDSVTATVTVYDFPHAFAVPDTSIACSPREICFTNFSTPRNGMFYSWTVDSVFRSSGWIFSNMTDSSSEHPCITFGLQDTFLVSLKDSNICGVDYWDTTIYINTTPSIQLDPVGDSCGTFVHQPMAMFEANGDSITSINWTIVGVAPGQMTTTFSGANPPPYPFDVGANSISVTATNACGATTRSVGFTIDTLTIVDAGLDSTVCLNADSVQLTGTPSPGFWLGPQIDSTGLFGHAVSGQYDFIYRFQASRCFVEDTVQVTVVDTPMIAIQADTAVCIYSGLLTFAASPTGGTWFGPDLQNGNQYDPDSAGTFSFLYLYLDTLTNCESSDIFTLTVNPLPVVNAGNDTTYCFSNFALPLPTATPPGGIWTGTGVSSGTGGTYNPALFGGAGQDTVIYTYVDANGCEASDTLLVNVIIATNAIAGPGDTLCHNAPLDTLTGFSPMGGSWRTTFSPNGMTDPGLGTYLPRVLMTGSNALIYTIAAGTSCESSDTTIVFIHDTIAVNAGARDIYCEGDGIVALSGYSPLTAGWTGTGVISANGVFNTDSITPGTTVFLTLADTNAIGCISQDVKPVFIDPLPTISINAPVFGCINVGNNFRDQSPGLVSRLWKFGDGTTSTARNPFKTYTAVGFYTVTLIGTNGNGCVDSSTHVIQISEPPTATFSMDVDSGCAPLVVTFTDLSNAAGASYVWNFGNGLSQTTPVPPAVTYLQGKDDTTYHISLVLTNGCGTSRMDDTVFVRPQPQVEFGIQVDHACSPALIFFASRTQGNPDSLLWDFGNGNFSNDSLPMGQYFLFSGASGASDTLYDITLIAFNECGSDTLVKQVRILRNDVNAFFNVDTARGCQPLTVQFTDFSFVPNVSWDFGDGSTSNQKNPSHTYVNPGHYTVRQFADNGCGFDTISQMIRVLPIRPAAFNVNTPVCLNQAMNFAPRDTVGITSYFWDFGDGTGTSARRPSHIYTVPGTYLVRLTTYSDSALCENSWDTLVTVHPLPSADFFPTPTVGCPPLNVALTGAPLGLSYFWDYGDPHKPQTAIGRTPPNHIYDSTGTYFVQLTTTDSNFCQNTRQISITVYPEPTANFTLTDTLCGLNSQVNFADQSSGNLLSHLWNFGDLTTLADTSLLTNPNYVYGQTGRFDVTKITTNTFGCADTLVKPATILPQPVAAFTATPTQDCDSFWVSFTQLSTDFSYVHWDFGNGNTSAVASPAPQLYQGFDTSYLVVMTLDTAGFCFDTATQLIEVASSPVAYFDIPSGDTVCGVPGFFDFQGGSTSAALPITCFWDFGDPNSTTDTTSVTSPSYTYTTTGVFWVTKVVTNSFGCTDTFRRRVVVLPAPVAAFAATPDRGCDSMLVSFSQLSSNISQANWDFGNGLTSSLLSPNPQLYLGQDTSYQVILWVDTAGFCFDSASTWIQVASKPVSDFTTSADTVCGTATQIDFTSTASSLVRPITCLWDFGDPTTVNDTSTQLNPSYTYSQTGTFTVTKYTFNDFGCVDSVKRQITVLPQPIAALTATPIQGCDAVTVTFGNLSSNYSNSFWDFDDGNFSFLQTPNPHTFIGADDSFYVQLVVDTAGFCFDTTTQLIAVASSPTAYFDVITSDTVCGAPGTFDFGGGSTTNALPITCFWDFGDLSITTDTASGTAPSYTYNQPGVYWVRKAVTNSYGCADTFVRRVVVLPQPVAGILATPDRGCDTVLVTFTNTSTGHGKSFWDFGNGNSSMLNTPVPQVYIGQDDSFYVQLAVDTAGFCFDTTTQLIQVAAGPISDFTISADTMCGAPVQFDFTSTASTTVQAITCFWDFGDPTTTNDTSSLANPSHIYVLPGTYFVTKITTNAFGCMDTVVKPVTVLPQPVASLTATPTQGCDAVTVTFGNLSTNHSSSFWDFDNNQFSNLHTPSPHTFIGADDSFYVVLTVDTADFCYDRDTVLIAVASSPTAYFDVLTPDTLCGVPAAFDFGGGSTSNALPITCFWNFGDPAITTDTSSLPSPTFSYAQPGVYFVRKAVTNTFGCTDTFVRRVVVLPQPVASLVATPDQGCDSVLVSFTNTSTGHSTSFWDFGNNHFSNLHSPGPLWYYGQDDSFYVQLAIDTADFCFDTTTHLIAVASTPQSAFSVSEDTLCGVPAQVSFAGQSFSAALPSRCFYDFGDPLTLADTSRLDSPSYTYTVPGTYTITKWVFNTFGCVDSSTQVVTILPQPVAAWSLSDTMGCDPLTVVINNLSTNISHAAWRFGDGATSQLIQPGNHVYTGGDTSYLMTLVVDTAAFCYDSIHQHISLASTPVSAFSVPIDTVCGAPASFLFDNQSNTLARPVTYDWDFGDPTTLADTSHQFEPSYTYGQPGTYVVRLIVENDFGCADTSFLTLVVYPQPVADFTAAPVQGCVPLLVQLNNLSTGHNHSFWDFGDGRSPINTSHQPGSYTYIDPDTTFTITLYIDTATFCFDTTHIVITTASPPVAAFTPSVDSICGGPATISFVDMSQSTLPIQGYRWDFGDGNGTSILQNPTYTYDSVGVFTVQLIVQNTFLCEDTTTHVIHIFPEPVAAFDASPVGGCAPLDVLLDNHSTNFTNALWKFGYSNLQTNVHEPGNHLYQIADTSLTLTLIVDTAGFCYDSTSVTIQTSSTPIADFTPSLQQHCGPTEVTFTNTSSTARFPLTYRWAFGNGLTSTAQDPRTNYSEAGTYTVKLVTTNSIGCADSTTQEITIYPQPAANFVAEPTEGCVPLAVLFTNLTDDTTFTLQRWTFGDGTSSEDPQPIHIYDQPGIYDVRLWVSYENECEDEIRFDDLITVDITPTADFTFREMDTSLITGPAGIFQFTNASQNASTYLWDFGDGNVTTDRNPRHQYLANGPFTVTLIARNANGCADTTEMIIDPNLLGYLYIPNAFAPTAHIAVGSQDGKVFKPKGVGLIDYHISVYNTWGNEVWSSTALDANGSPAESWDGTVKGVLVNTDAFIWKVHKAEFRGNGRWPGPWQGTLTLIR